MEREGVRGRMRGMQTVRATRACGRRQRVWQRKGRAARCTVDSCVGPLRGLPLPSQRCQWCCRCQLSNAGMRPPPPLLVHAGVLSLPVGTNNPLCSTLPPVSLSPPPPPLRLCCPPLPSSGGTTPGRCGFTAPHSSRPSPLWRCPSSRRPPVSRSPAGRRYPRGCGLPPRGSSSRPSPPPSRRGWIG